MESSSTKHVAPGLDHSLGPLEGELGDPEVVGGLVIAGGRQHLGLDVAPHVGDLLGSLVDEEHHHVDLRIIGDHRLGDALEHDRLARLWRGDDEGPLALPQGGDEVEHPGDEFFVVVLELDALNRVHRGEIAEVGQPSGDVDRVPVDRLHADDGALEAPHLGLGDQVLTGPKPQLLDQVLGDLRVVRPGQQVVFDAPQRSVLPLDVEVEDPLDGLGGDLHGLPRDLRLANVVLLLLLGLLLCLALLPGVELDGGQEDVHHVSVRLDHLAERLTVFGEEDRVSLASSSPSSSSAGRLAP